MSKNKFLLGAISFVQCIFADPASIGSTCDSLKNHHQNSGCCDTAQADGYLTTGQNAHCKRGEDFLVARPSGGGVRLMPHKFGNKIITIGTAQRSTIDFDSVSNVPILNDIGEIIYGDHYYEISLDSNGKLAADAEFTCFDKITDAGISRRDPVGITADATHYYTASPGDGDQSGDLLSPGRVKRVRKSDCYMEQIDLIPPLAEQSTYPNGTAVNENDLQETRLMRYHGGVRSGQAELTNDYVVVAMNWKTVNNAPSLYRVPKSNFVADAVVAWHPQETTQGGFTVQAAFTMNEDYIYYKNSENITVLNVNDMSFRHYLGGSTINNLVTHINAVQRIGEINYMLLADSPWGADAVSSVFHIYRFAGGLETHCTIAGADITALGNTSLAFSESFGVDETETYGYIGGIMDATGNSDVTITTPTIVKVDISNIQSGACSLVSKNDPVNFQNNERADNSEISWEWLTTYDVKADGSNAGVQSAFDNKQPADIDWAYSTHNIVVIDDTIVIGNNKIWSAFNATTMEVLNRRFYMKAGTEWVNYPLNTCEEVQQVYSTEFSESSCCDDDSTGIMQNVKCWAGPPAPPPFPPPFSPPAPPCDGNSFRFTGFDTWGDGWGNGNIMQVGVPGHITRFASEVFVPKDEVAQQFCVPYSDTCVKFQVIAHGQWATEMNANVKFGNADNTYNFAPMGDNSMLPYSLSSPYARGLYTVSLDTQGLECDGANTCTIECEAGAHSDATSFWWAISRCFEYGANVLNMTVVPDSDPTTVNINVVTFDTTTTIPCPGFGNNPAQRRSLEEVDQKKRKPLLE